MKKLFLFLLLMSPSLLFADMYAVEREDGGVSIINYYGGEPLEKIVKELGFWGLPITKVSSEDLPDTKEDREFWKMNDLPWGDKIKVDSVKKTAEENNLKQKNKAREDLKKKLNVTDAELEILKG